MPVVQEKWISSPLSIVQELFAQSSSPNAPSWGVREFFESKINSQQALSKIPSLNHVPLHHLPEGCLVRYRAMIQDQFDPEFYFKVYTSRHKQNKTETVHCGMYRDVTDHSVDSELLFEHPSNVTGDRLTLYCVPIPGETKWTKECYEEQSSFNQSFTNSSAASQSSLKRPLSEECVASRACEGCEGMDVEGGGDGLASKRPREGNADTMETSSAASSRHDMNFPLPNEEGIPAMVKVYSEFDSLKVTSIVEFIGILSTDPSLAHFDHSEASADDNMALVDPMSGETAAERKAHAPPPSLIPRLHVITTHILSHSCPLLPRELAPPVKSSVLGQLMCDVPSARQMTLDLLTEALLGDRLTAEYLLLHLISSVYGRTEVLALGKFCLNISKCPATGPIPFPDSVHSLLETIVTKCHLLKMSLDNMNKSRFSPKKDYQANRLTAGLLQLSEGTHLVVDETAMTPGQLTEVGVKNLTILGNVIQLQKIQYDFQYHTMDFDCNLPVLVFSEGKSILQTECLVPLVPSSPPPQHSQPTAAQLNQIRIYLALCRMLEYKLSDEVKKNLEEDFVAMRRSDPSMNAEVFHHLLGLARLIALSHGACELTMDHWTHTKQLEGLRKDRLK